MSKESLLSAFAIYNKGINKNKTKNVNEKKKQIGNVIKNKYSKRRFSEDLQHSNATARKKKKIQKRNKLKFSSDSPEISSEVSSKESDMVNSNVRGSVEENEQTSSEDLQHVKSTARKKKKVQNKFPLGSPKFSSDFSSNESDMVNLYDRESFDEGQNLSTSNNESPQLPSVKFSPVCMNKQLKKKKIKENSVNVVMCEPEENSFKTSKNLFHFLLMPVKSGTFFESYWEKESLCIKRDKPNHFQNVLTTKHLDRILREHPLYYTRNVDVVTYEDGIRQTHNPEGRAVAASVWDYYSNGCSVRILNPQTYCKKVHLMLETLQEYFGTMVGANVYLTPPGSQGFAPHYDDIEAFILQLEGRKHWKIYEPRTESEKLPRHSSPNFSRNELGVPIRKVTLEQGDLLYFPRGFIHEACTDEGAHSLHITISVYQNTAYVDILEKLLPEALKIAAKHDVEFREGLPLNYLKHIGSVNVGNSSDVRNEITLKVKNLIKKLVEHAPVDWAADQMGRKFMYDALPPILTSSEKNRSFENDGYKLENGIVCNRVEFSLDTMVRLVRYHSLRMIIENETLAKIYYCTENANSYHGEEEQSLEIDMNSGDIIKILLKEYPNYIRIGNLPCAERLQVVSDLWEHGLIITKKPLETQLLEAD